MTIDVSLSMEAMDVEPNRLDAAKAGAEQFVTSLPPKFNVALVTFAGTATVLVPPTMDHGSVTAAIRSLRPQASTAIGEGIYTSLAALAQVPPDPDNPGPAGPHRPAERRQDPGRPTIRSGCDGRTAQSVAIYTIAYGTLMVTSISGGAGSRYPLIAEMARIAKISGGRPTRRSRRGA